MFSVKISPRRFFPPCGGLEDILKRQRNNKSRTEAILSVIITTALVLTLALTVATAINKGNSDENNNIVDLNETDGYNAQLNNDNSTTPTPEATKEDSDNLVANNTKPTEKATSSEDSNNETEVSEENETQDADTNELIAAHIKPTEEDIAVNVIDSVTSNLSFSENSTLFWPVTGDVILKYNMDNTIWFPTLGVYKCNPAIYISSETGSKISSSCTGVVDSIYNNEETGTTVVVSIGNGYSLTYGQVSGLQVTKGDIVKAGDTIGFVAEPTIYYSEEGSGLYFKVECNDEPCDPMMFLE